MGTNNLVFASACLGILIFGISLVTLGSVAPGLQAAFKLDKISAGALFSILPVGILAGSLVFGPFADRFGYKIILILSALIIFAGFQGIAYSNSIEILKGCIFLFGVGGGVLNGATNAVVSDITETNKGANLSLLGVFFAIGALGMPFILGTLQSQFHYQQIVSAVGILPLIAIALFTFARFPGAKQRQKFPLEKSWQLMRNEIILLVGFFLFCQSSFEAIINNWTTTYFIQKLFVPESNALYALSLYVLAMAIIRILIGGALRKTSNSVILGVSMVALLAGCYLLWWSSNYVVAVAGLILIGVGLAAGFPIMLGIIGSKFEELSGTAFSIVLTIALVGNMIVNVIMGVIAEKYGILYLTSMAFGLTVVMTFLFIAIKKKLETNQ